MQHSIKITHHILHFCTQWAISLHLPKNTRLTASSTTTWVSQYQKSKTTEDFNEARDDGVLGWQWHQPDHMQTV